VTASDTARPTAAGADIISTNTYLQSLEEEVEEEEEEQTRTPIGS
jgi:hypothetical protein